MKDKDIDYGDYLRLRDLLSLQNRESDKARPGEKTPRPAHDEMLFIVMHQTYELWFKQILFELELIQAIFGGPTVDDAKLGRAVHAAERIVKIFHLLVGQIDVLETMTPMDFLEFRDLLIPASGFQSEQFRQIEARLGLPRAARLKFNTKDFDASFSKAAQDLIRNAEKHPLREQVNGWLERTPFVREPERFDFSGAYRKRIDESFHHDLQVLREHPHLSPVEKAGQVSSLEQSRAAFNDIFADVDDATDSEPPSGEWTFSRRALRAALFIFLFRDEPAVQMAFRMLNALMDIDETLSLWRTRHVLMVSRMLGRKIGTGGSSGHDYLRTTIDRHRAYNDLFAIATFLIPRSALPDIGDDMRAWMGYHYGQERKK